MRDAEGDHHHRHQTGGCLTLDLRNLKVISALGRGAKGVVFLVQSVHGESLALKTISRSSISKNESSSGDSADDDECVRISFEQQVLRSFNHLLLPKLRGILLTENFVGYAIDYCPGGNLNSLRKKQTEKMFSGDIIRFYAAELVIALEYLHKLGIMYRDLKPENVMVQENGHLMLVDFDLSTKLFRKPSERRKIVKPLFRSEPMKKNKLHSVFQCCSCNSGFLAEDSVHPTKTDSSSTSLESEQVQKSNSFVGTEEYVAPEIILGNGHDFSVDWWCLGVVLYEMLYGTTPFKGSNRKDTFYKILTQSPHLVGEQTSLRNLIRKLLEKDPMRRISIEEIKGHDFFDGLDWDLILQTPRPPFIPVRREFEDTVGNNGIDVEEYVQEIFKVGVGDVLAETNKTKYHEQENRDGTADDNFVIF